MNAPTVTPVERGLVAGRALAFYAASLVWPVQFGGALQALGRLDEARAQFREALRLRPDFPQARENLERLAIGGRGR